MTHEVKDTDVDAGTPTGDGRSPVDGADGAAPPDGLKAVGGEAPQAGGAAEAPAELSGGGLAAERDALKDQLLRISAEFDNYRKRTERERREMIDRAAEGVLSELLPIVDDLERALAADTDDAGARAYREGVELIHRQLVDLLSRRGVTAIDALGEDFDPHVHQAVTSEPADGRRDGEIVEELRRGYRLGERLLRPAMVKVAKA